MILLSLLIVIFLERSNTASGIWHYQYYYQRYNDFIQSRLNLSSTSRVNQNTLLWVFIPVVVVGAIQMWLGATLFALLFAIFVLYTCMGCTEQRAGYKRYLEAANRGDLQACDMHALALGNGCEQTKANETLGQTLIWINFKYYLAIIFWFVVLGPCGAILYVVSRTLNHFLAQQDDLSQAYDVNLRLMKILDFVPVRIAGFAYLFVGNFSQAFPLWMKHLLDLAIEPRDYLTQVAVAAEEVEAPENDMLTEPCTLVKLAKRAVLFCVALVASLSLAGLIH